MRRYESTLTSNGQVTLPPDVREHLGLTDGDRVSFVIKGSGEVILQVPKYSTLDSLAGVAGKLDRSLDFEEMLEIARDDALVDKYVRSRQRSSAQQMGS